MLKPLFKSKMSNWKYVVRDKKLKFFIYRPEKACGKPRNVGSSHCPITCSCADVIFDVIQGLQVKSAHEIDLMQLLSWVEWMRDERTLLWIQNKWPSPQVQMRAVFVALISKFQ